MIRQTTRILTLAFTGLLVGWLALGAAHAEDEHDHGGKPNARGLKILRVPSVKGMDAGLAIQRLEQMGFGVRVLTIADQRAGFVYKQIPEFNSVLEPGEEIVLLVGVESLIQTLVPDVRGALAEAVLPTLEEAYIVDVREVDGRPQDAGRIMSQSPNAGSTHPMRGVLIVTIGRAPLLVPRLLGLQEAEARAAAEAAGLLLEVRRVTSGPQGARGSVLSQDPRSGAEVLPGTVVVVQVFGVAPTTPTDVVAVPHLVGLGMADAQDAVIALGLVPHLDVEATGSARAGTVIRQEEQPGTALHLGAHVHFTVQIRTGNNSGLRMPAFVGAEYSHVREVLRTLGAQVTVRQVPSAMPEGTILRQTPAPGERVAHDTQVSLDVAARAPDGWGQDVSTMPQLTGLRVGQARAIVLARGFSLRIRQREVPGAALNRVAQQNPVAGTRVRVSSAVEIVVPIATRAPNLIGQDVSRAQILLQLAGLRGVIDGAGGGSSRRVKRQSVPAGTPLARGSEIRLRLERSNTPGINPGPGQLVSVPDVRGKDLAQAEQILTASGFRVSTQGAQLGVGRAEIVTQNVAPGMRVPYGTNIILRYEWRVLGPGGDTLSGTMPNVVGQTLGNAKRILLGLGMGVQIRGVGVQNDRAMVRTQSPNAGTRIRRGTRAIITVGGAAPAGVIVMPSVIGQTGNLAKANLEALGLMVLLQGSGILAGSAPIAEQSIAPGTRVARGTRVVLTSRSAISPGAAAVPSVVGQSKRDATRLLEGLGFRVRVRGIDIRIGNRRPKVRRQDPVAGAQANPGDTVTIYMGL